MKGELERNRAWAGANHTSNLALTTVLGRPRKWGKGGSGGVEVGESLKPLGQKTIKLLIVVYHFF